MSIRARRAKAMGFDIHFECVERGGPGEIPIALIKNSFGPYANFDDDNCATFAYPDGGRGELFTGKRGPTTGGFMVARPPVHPEFWRAIFELLRQTTSFLWWPGLETFVIANPATRDHFPKELIEGLEESILVVMSGEQILEKIRKS